MHPYLENKVGESLQELKDKQGQFTNKQAEIIKSLPEEERLRIFKAMHEDKKRSSLYQAWLNLGKGWKVFIKIVLTIILFFFVVTRGFLDGWKSFQEFTHYFSTY